MVVYRIIGGVGIGVVSIVSPLYISEVAVAQYRGRLVSLYQLAVTVGFLGAYLINYQLLAYAESGNQLSMDWLNKIFVTEVWRECWEWKHCRLCYSSSLSSLFRRVLVG